MPSIYIWRYEDNKEFENGIFFICYKKALESLLIKKKSFLIELTTKDGSSEAQPMFIHRLDDNGRIIIENYQ